MPAKSGSSDVKKRKFTASENDEDYEWPNKACRLSILDPVAVYSDEDSFGYGRGESEEESQDYSVPAAFREKCELNPRLSILESG